ncbi:MAG: hypothetical protein U9Q83_05030 [Bacteroidota bacterium]|nr:hypothetical protein [Bacteroidota bacterium]
METIFVQNYLEIFSKNVKKIINEIECQCDCFNDYHAVLKLINKLNFYTQNFFIDNEIAKKDKSKELNIIKKQSEIFSYTLKKYQYGYELGDKKEIYKMKEFLKTWLKEPFLSEV